MITAERLREMFTYDAIEGRLRWRTQPHPRSGKNIGDIAGGWSAGGYRQLNIAGRTVLEHRLIWLHQKGSWPSAEIDHINGVRNDNRLENLREATKSQNQANKKIGRNNRSGYKGVFYETATGKWLARLNLKEGLRTVGRFSDKMEAVEAYREEATRIFGEFVRFE